MWTLITIVIGVTAASAILGWMAFRLARHMNRIEQEPTYRRRWLLYGAAIYGVGIVAGVSQVFSGDAPPIALLGVPIPILIVWLCLRSAKQVKIPPDPRGKGSGP